ncbi:putative calcium-dependent protein kinase, partial [Corchorus capsularis]
MGQCYGKVNRTGVYETPTSNATTTTTTTVVVPADRAQTPLPSGNGAVNVNVPSVKNTPARSSNQNIWPSPFPHGVSASPLPPGVSPSPARPSRAHPWLRDESRSIPLDILIYKLVKSYIHATPFKRAALKALARNATEAMEESRVPDILSLMGSLAYRKLYFEEFCAAAISIYHLEGVEDWEQIASTAFEHFEQEGNRVISSEEFARELNIAGPSALTYVRDCIRTSDGKLNLIG